MATDEIRNELIDTLEINEYPITRRRRRRSSAVSQIDTDNEVSSNLVKSSVSELVNVPDKNTVNTHSLFDFSHLFCNTAINLEHYPDIQDMLAARQANKLNNSQDGMFYGCYQLPRFLPRGDIGFAYAFYEEVDGEIHFFNKDEETEEEGEITVEDACLEYRTQLYTYVVCKDIFPTFEKILTRHGWKLSLFDTDWAISRLDTTFDLESFSISEFQELPKSHDDILRLLISWFVEEFPWNNYSCNFAFADISLNLESTEAYYWIEAENLEFLTTIRLSADYDIKFQLILFNYFVDKLDENIYIKTIINKILWVIVCLCPYQENITPIVENLAEKTRNNSWIADAVKERVEYLKNIFHAADSYNSDLDDFISEFKNLLYNTQII